ncbi:MAG: prolipoprotein diacylglyceryl transferase [Clostridia bacterium]|nr:prolipoprotein diacylglyceryl transferase [Clostridia bacterium]
MFGITRWGLKVFGLELRWYGMLIALGVVCAVLVALRREKALGIEKDTTLNLALVCVPVGIICARIYYVIFSWENYAGSLRDILDIRQGGLAIYGGVIGGVIAGAIYSAVKKVKLARLADLAAPSLALGQCIGRWGNFFNQEAYGGAILDPKLQFFPLGVFIEGSGWHFATFFYESLWCAIIVCLLLAGEKKRVFRRSGDIALWYLILYAAERSFVEGLRTDSLYIGPLRVSQLISIIVMFIVACVFALRKKKSLLSWLPAFTSVMTGAAAALHSNLLTAVFALLSVVFAAVVYIANEKKNPSTPV